MSKKMYYKYRLRIDIYKEIEKYIDEVYIYGYNINDKLIVNKNDLSVSHGRCIDTKKDLECEFFDMYWLIRREGVNTLSPDIIGIERIILHYYVDFDVLEFVAHAEKTINDFLEENGYIDGLEFSFKLRSLDFSISYPSSEEMNRVDDNEESYNLGNDDEEADNDDDDDWQLMLPFLKKNRDNQFRARHDMLERLAAEQLLEHREFMIDTYY